MEYFSYKKNLKTLSRQLRGCLTDAEKLLWSKIRRKQIKDYQFFRQKPIGNFIVDFYCKKAQLVIEIDGGQHIEDKIILEAKTKRFLTREDYYQLKRYLSVLRKKLGIIVNFHQKYIQPKRILNSSATE